MPIDLIIEILSRLPCKSIARFRCVSKLWASILRRPDFTELFLTRSSSRSPRFLFACRKGGKLFLFSAPQPQNPKENSSSLLASYLMKISFDTLNGFDTQCERIRTVRGLVFVSDRVGKHMLCNPSTRESLTLHRLKTRKGTEITSYICYDHVEKQHKVLSMTDVRYRRRDHSVSKVEHQVLTMGPRNLRGE
ncbi:unnamed protein product [Cochlearia groenlandica]